VYVPLFLRSCGHCRYGDLESFAKQSGAKQKRKEDRGAKRSSEHDSSRGGGVGVGGDGGGDESGDNGGGGGGGDDPFCSRMLEAETAPLRERIAELEYQNTELQRQLDLVAEPLIHEDL
jgi:hypothetical protein